MKCVRSHCNCDWNRKSFQMGMLSSNHKWKNRLDSRIGNDSNSNNEILFLPFVFLFDQFLNPEDHAFGRLHQVVCNFLPEANVYVCACTHSDVQLTHTRRWPETHGWTKGHKHRCVAAANNTRHKHRCVAAANNTRHKHRYETAANNTWCKLIRVAATHNTRHKHRFVAARNNTRQKHRCVAAENNTRHKHGCVAAANNTLTDTAQQPGGTRQLPLPPAEIFKNLFSC